MTRNLKTLGLTMAAVLVLGALLAQGASTAEAHEFRSDGSWTIGTGEVAALTLQVGEVGTITCKVLLEDQSGGSFNGEEYLNDELTVTPKFTECTFGGQPAAFFVNHCAFVLDSETTAGNPTGGEHANVTIECAEGQKIQIHTTNCTITVAPQVVKHAIQYQADTSTSVKGIVAAHGIVLGKERNTATQPLNGCLAFPPNGSAVGKATGNGTTECFRDEGSVLTGTEKTTPSGTKEGEATECSVK